jgi:hypothetical protein
VKFRDLAFWWHFLSFDPFRSGSLIIKECGLKTIDFGLPEGMPVAKAQ